MAPGAGLGRLCPGFRAASLEPELLAHLTTDDLRNIGIHAVGHRKRLEQAISRLKAPIGLAAALPNAAGSDITTAAPATIVAATPANSEAELESRDATAFRPMKLFLSYGRDALVPDVPRVLLSTGKMVGEGFDHPPLDTLVLAMPVSWKGTLQQYAGRLHREHVSKTDVRIIDIVDTGHPALVRMWDKRQRGYRAMG